MGSQSAEATQRNHTIVLRESQYEIIALALSLASLVQGESLFLPTALDGVEIKLRGRDRGPDITQVELHIRPKEVALSGAVPSLEYKEEGGCWKPAPKKIRSHQPRSEKEVAVGLASALQEVQVSFRIAIRLLR